MILREDQLLEPKIQRILKKKEKERERAILQATEDFDGLGMIKGVATKKQTPSGKKQEVPLIQYGYGKKNPNVAKKHYSKKQKKKT